MLMQYILVAVGGAGGALGRYGVARLVSHYFPGQLWPLATFLVNLLGCSLIGVLYVVITEKSALHPDWRHILMVGFLGAFTTFSTFSLETVALFQTGKAAVALLYAFLTLVSCVLGCWLGILLAR